MKVSFRWLRALVPDRSLSAEEVAERLASRGAPVESMESLSEGLDDIVIARVRTVREHPNADRLRLCDVEGPNGVVQVVCGAPVIEEGGFYPFAPVGAELPGGLQIREVKIRGETSKGMLCSEKELGLGEDHSGILLLEGAFEIGQSFVQALALDDARLEVEVTANRGDLLSHLGVAREIAPEGVDQVQLPAIPGGSHAELATATDPRRVVHPDAPVSIEIEDPDLCPRYLGIVIRGVQVGPSPAWLQRRLRAAGSRPINNVVDATNYVLLELGQPLHAFDLDRLGGSAIVVRRARQGETIRTLDGVDRTLSPEMLAICDAERPVAVAGVMGGGKSEVSDETRDILLECALFDPRSVRATRKALGMSTDASYRFERGVDPEGLVRAATRAAEIIVATAGGEIDGPVLDVCPQEWSRPSIALRPDRVAQVLGVTFRGEELHGILQKLGFEAEARREEPIQVSVPGFRSWDVTREVDLIEEIARVHGFDRFPAELGAYRPTTVPDDPVLRLLDRVRDLLVRRGILEAQLPGFARHGEVRLQNPISTEEAFLRDALLPGLVGRVEHNFAHGVADVRLFEIGTAFFATENGAAPAPGADGGANAKGAGRTDPLPREEIRVGVVLTGAREPRHFSRSPDPLGIWDAKGILEDLVRTLGHESVMLEALPPGGGPRALLDRPALEARTPEGAAAGWVGRIAPDRIDAPPWADEVWGVEVVLPGEVAAQPSLLVRPLPTFPAVERDLALILPETIEAGAIEARIDRHGGPYLESVEVFDVYEGAGLPAGARSVAFRLRFRSADRTLRDEEVEEGVARITRVLKEEFDVEPRRG